MIRTPMPTTLKKIADSYIAGFGLDTFNLSFRGSNLFICPRAWVLFKLLSRKHQIYRLVPDYLQYYFTMGNAVHDLIRKKLSRKGLIHGNWKCDNCGKVRYGYIENCETCKVSTEIEYVEKSVTVSGIGMHMDAFYSPEAWNVSDSQVMEIKSYHNNFPTNEMIDHYRYQANSYAWAEKKDCYYLCFVKVEKNLPFKIIKSSYSQRRMNKVLESREVCRNAWVEYVSDPRSILKLEGDCETVVQGKYCTLQQLCFSPKILEVLQTYQEEEK